MSHFTVLVTGDDVEAAMAPFYEELEVERHISQSRAELIAYERKRMENTRDTNWAEYLANPAKYIAECRNPRHIEYFTGGEFEAKLTWTDEQFHAEAIRFTDPADLDEDGNEWSTSNPQSKWDWWTVGGRWDGGLRTKDGREVNECLRSELHFEHTHPTFAVLVDGQWIERGSMGWWAMVSDEKAPEEWHPQWLKIVAALPDETRFTLVDAHI